MTIMVHMRHVRAAKLCSKGARAWFEQYGLSWNEFLSNGMSADDLEATGDALALRVTAIARKEASHGER